MGVSLQGIDASDRRWVILFFLALLLLFFNLGLRPFWGAEGRWVEAVREMELSGQFFAPTINGHPHLTKPLVPYWLILASAKVFGGLNEWTARLPAALCGLLALVSFYFLARHFFSSRIALLSTGLFLSCYGFFNYARLTLSEIYQLAWITAALAWYVWHRKERSFKAYLIFWLLADLAALSKGLTGLAVLILVVLVDWGLRRDFAHLNLKALAATLIGLGLYFLHYYAMAQAVGSKLPFYLFVRENLLQAVSPYDHREPFYVYILYWPELLLPWTPLFLLALFWTLKNWSRLRLEARFILLANLAVFLLFTLARCRRFYYILPILPLSVLLMGLYLEKIYPRFEKLLWRTLYFFLVLEFVVFAIIQPLFSSRAEKVFGRALASFLEHHPGLKPCAYRKVSANLLFYLGSKEPIPVYQKFPRHKECDLVFFRERYFRREPSLQDLPGMLYELPEKWRSKDTNKNYLLWLPEGGDQLLGLREIPR